MGMTLVMKCAIGYINYCQRRVFICSKSPLTICTLITRQSTSVLKVGNALCIAKPSKTDGLAFYSKNSSLIHYFIYSYTTFKKFHHQTKGLTLLCIPLVMSLCSLLTSLQYVECIWV